MIEPMKKLYLAGQTKRKSTLLRNLRHAGIVHVADVPAPHSADSQALRKEAEMYSRIESAISDFAGKETVEQVPYDKDGFGAWAQSYAAAASRRKELSDRIAKDSQEADKIRPWGSFSLDEIRELEGKGIRLSFWTMAPKSFAKLDPSVPAVELAPVQGQAAFALVNSDAVPEGAQRYDLPDRDLKTIEAEIASDTREVETLTETLQKGGAYRDALKKAEAVNAQAQTWQEVSDGMGGDEQICYLTGWLPAKKVADFEALAKKNGWGYALEDPSDEDNPPTLLRYTKGFSIMSPIYDLIGITPGYRERDITVPFLLFFIVFFSMIIGDGGYGLIFLILGIMLAKKKGKSDVSSLIIVLALATMVWGAVTGTWFGSTWILEHVPFLRRLTIPELANIPQFFTKSDGSPMDAKTVQDHVMNFSFVLGTLQLALACVMNIVYKAPRKNLSWVADLAWFCDIVLLYDLILKMLLPSIKAPIDFPMSVIGTVVGIGYIVVLVFGNQAPGKKFSDGVKEGLMGFLPTFLNTISCFSNIMSYIRLFAVGMAGFAISQSFNSMAAGLLNPVRFVGIVGFLLIVLLGHSLNIVMCLLSVIVHGVRLNILEFSNQLGMEWSGYKFDPFRETVKNEN